MEGTTQRVVLITQKNNYMVSIYYYSGSDTFRIITAVVKGLSNVSVVIESFGIVFQTVQSYNLEQKSARLGKLSRQQSLKLGRVT